MKEPTPIKGWALSKYNRVSEELFFLLLQRGAEDVAKARTGVG
jgi:hypothetical protein